MSSPADPNAHAVEVQELRFHYPDGTPALDGISLHIGVDQSVCLAGPNGAGKSTLLLILAGLIQGEGIVRVGGVEPATNWQLGLVFQDPDDQLFCPTVAEDVAFGPRNQKLDEQEVTRRVAESLAAAALRGFGARSAHHLSGGEKKRAAIAAVLACQPAVLALDEPWANLDARGARAVTKIIREFSGTRIVASQDLYHAAEVCQRMILLDEGRIVADGPMESILADNALLEQHGVDFSLRCRFCPEANPARAMPPREA